MGGGSTRRAARQLRVAWAAALSIVAVLMLSLPVAPAHGVKFTKYYKGTVVGDSAATVAFRIRVSDKGERRWAEFQFANVQIFYEDGTVGRESAPLNLFRFRTRHIFHNGDLAAQANLASFYEVRGELLGGGRARGYLEMAVDFYNPPPPDWSTGGRVYWKAQRTP
jgi:hypothetical protein